MIKIKTGRQLSEKFIQNWNNEVQEEFECNELLNPKNRKNFFKDIFFILENNNKLLSIGRIKSVKIRYRGKDYNVLGIADVLSLVKRKGYGIKLVQSMKKYIENTKKSEISFCHPSNTKFYEKCGLIILKNRVKQFYYQDNEGKIHKNHWDKDLICIEGKDKLLSKIISHPNEKIKLSLNFF
jgi:predicted acetyltransferase